MTTQNNQNTVLEQNKNSNFLSAKLEPNIMFDNVNKQDSNNISFDETKNNLQTNLVSNSNILLSVENKTDSMHSQEFIQNKTFNVQKTDVNIELLKNNTSKIDKNNSEVNLPIEEKLCI